MASTEPVLALDVDGVLLAWADTLEEVHELESAGYTNKDSYGRLIYYDPTIGPKLHEIIPHFETIYCTGHEGRAHKNAGSLFGLPAFGYVPLHKFERASDKHLNDCRRRALSAVCGSRALAWAEDEATEDDFMWAEERSATVAPTLLIRPEHKRGLTNEHMSVIRAWLKNLTP